MSFPGLPARTINRDAALAMISVISIGLGGFSTQKRHPRLVKVASTHCINCHEDLYKGRDHIHPGTNDCTTCHDVRISESGTEITLTGQHPLLCVKCHDELVPAANAEMEFSHAPVSDSCILCHEPHASNLPKLLALPIQSLCDTCHELSGLGEAHRGQLTEKTNCLRCHLPHGSPNKHMVSGSQLHPPFADGDCNSCHRAPLSGRIRLRAKGERICSACHGDIIEPAVDGGSQHPALIAKRPYAGCVSCHDPHMSSRDSLLVSEGPQLCTTCHQDVVTASLDETGHPAAAKDCTSCHAPHRSEQARLLNEPLPGLCFPCHDPKDDDLAKAHLGADVASLECMSCHSPHGAGNPKLLARFVHSPTLDKCEICHQGSAEKLVANGESDLCLACHNDIGEFARKATVSHDVLENRSCTVCHNPHASAQEHLVRAPNGGACGECHEEQVASENEFAHGVIALIGCRACHEPHGGDNPKLLRRTGNGLCLACHDAQNMPVARQANTIRLLDRFELPADALRTLATLRLSADGQRDHPVTGHRVLGTPTEAELKRNESTFEGELTCLTCHDPHKSTTPQMLVGNVMSPMESCAQCHPK